MTARRHIRTGIGIVDLKVCRNLARMREQAAASTFRGDIPVRLADTDFILSPPRGKRATFYRWHKRPEFRSRRPRRACVQTRVLNRVEAVRALRCDDPMWGRAGIAVLLQERGTSPQKALSDASSTQVGILQGEGDHNTLI